MHVHIIGPNLRDQSKGDFHVHAAGCRDIHSAAYAGPDFKHDRENTYEVTSQRDAADQVYADQIDEGSMTAGDGVDSMWFAPCVDDLPHTDAESTFPAEINKEASIVILGNAVDGLSFFGPFDNSEDALNYAEQEHQGDDYLIASITNVQCDENGEWL